MKTNEHSTWLKADRLLDIRDIHLRAIHLRDLIAILDGFNAHDARSRGSVAAIVFCAEGLADGLVDRLDDFIEMLS